MWAAVKWFIGLLLGLIGGLVIGKIIQEVAGIGEVKEPKNWVPAGKDSILILDDDYEGEKKIRLPIDPNTRKRVKHSDIAAVGIAKKGEKINVTILHTPTDRSISGNV